MINTKLHTNNKNTSNFCEFSLTTKIAMETSVPKFHCCTRNSKKTLKLRYYKIAFTYEKAVAKS